MRNLPHLLCSAAAQCTFLLNSLCQVIWVRFSNSLDHWSWFALLPPPPSFLSTIIFLILFLYIRGCCCTVYYFFIVYKRFYGWSSRNLDNSSWFVTAIILVLFSLPRALLCRMHITLARWVRFSYNLDHSPWFAPLPLSTNTLLTLFLFTRRRCSIVYISDHSFISGSHTRRYSNFLCLLLYCLQLPFSMHFYTWGFSLATLSSSWSLKTWPPMFQEVTWNSFCKAT